MKSEDPEKAPASAKHIKIPPREPPLKGTSDTAAITEEGAKSAIVSKPLPMVLRVEDFPDKPRGNGGPPSTLENVAFICAFYKVFVGYNVIKKQLVIRMKGHPGMTDNAANTAITRIQSLAARHGMGISFVPALLTVLGDQNPFNPVEDWILSKPWDGEDRLPAFYATITTEETFPNGFKQVLMFRWALSAVAAALLPSGFRARGVLTLQGPPRAGQNKLVPQPCSRSSSA